MKLSLFPATTSIHASRALILSLALFHTSCAVTPEGHQGAAIGGLGGAAVGALIAKNNDVDPLVGALVGGLVGGIAGSLIGDHIAYRRQGFRTRSEYLRACRQSATQANEHALNTRNQINNRLPQIKRDLSRARQNNDKQNLAVQEKTLKGMRSDIAKQRGTLNKEIKAQRYALQTEGQQQDQDWLSLQQKLKSIETRQNELAAQDQQLQSTLAGSKR